MLVVDHDRGAAVGGGARRRRRTREAQAGGQRDHRESSDREASTLCTRDRPGNERILFYPREVTTGKIKNRSR